MTTEFDRRLNEWFDVVEPTELPSFILPQVFIEIDHLGQRRKPWHRFAASMEAAWTRRSALSPTLVFAILAGLLIVTLVVMAVVGGAIHFPRPPVFVDGLIAVEDAQDVEGDQQIRFIDPATGNDVFATPDSAAACAAHFSPDGTRYALLYQDPDQISTGVVNIGVANTRGDFEPEFLFRKEAQIWFDPAWAPDGSAIVTTIEPVTSDENGPGGRLWVLRTDGTAPRMLTDVETGHSTSWSASGNWIAFVGMGPDHPLYVISPDGTDLRKLRDSGVGSVAWSPTTDQLAFMGSDGRLHVVKPDGAEAAAIANSPSPPDQGLGDVTPAWSPDGTRIALTYGGLKVIDVSSGAVSTIATSVQGGPVDWSADGQRLVTTNDAGNLLELSLNGSAPRLIASHLRGACMSAGRALSWQKVAQ